MQKYKKCFLIVCFSLLVFGYLCGVWMFHGKFLPGTTVNKHSVALKSPEEVTLDMQSETGRHKVEFVLSNNQRRTLTFRDLGIFSQNDEMLLCEIPKTSWLWPVGWWISSDYMVDDYLVYDVVRVKEHLKAVSWLQGGSVIEDSQVRIVPDGDTFRFVGTGGNQYVDINVLADVIGAHIQEGDWLIDLSKEHCYQSVENVPQMSSVLLTGQSCEDLRDLSLQIDFGQGVVEAIPQDILEAALYKEQQDVFVRPNILLSYLYALGDKYDTVNVTRTFHTTSGKSVTCVSRVTDTYKGYDLDENSMLLSVIQCLSEGRSGVIPAVWTTVGKDLVGSDNDFGNTYIEISLADQHMWYIENGQVVLDTDVVTGLDVDGRRTPNGLFFVRGLYRNYRMYYEDSSSVADYFIHVTGGVGVHDSSREHFGGQIYKNAGSHGCINTPYAVEKMLFEKLEQLPSFEIPVIVY